MKFEKQINAMLDVVKHAEKMSESYSLNDVLRNLPSLKNSVAEYKRLSVGARPRKSLRKVSKQNQALRSAVKAAVSEPKEKKVKRAKSPARKRKKEQSAAAASAKKTSADTAS